MTVGEGPRVSSPGHVASAVGKGEALRFAEERQANTLGSLALEQFQLARSKSVYCL